MSMNPEIKQEWEDDLRSGNYLQGRATLRSVDGKFCCLGVLCEQAVRKGIIPPPSKTTVSGFFYEGCSTYLPEKVREWAGLDSQDPRVSSAEGEEAVTGWNTDRLSELNDSGNTFDQIANYIHRSL